VASLVQKGDAYGLAWGFFKADSTDCRTLSVEAYSPLDAAMIKDFINSGGKYTEFSCNGVAKTVYRVETDGDNNRTRTLIYQGESDSLSAVDASSANEPATTPRANYTGYIVGGVAGAVTIASLLVFYNLRKHSR